MWAGKRSLGKGLLALLTVGYFYGIIRANTPDIASHFLFDASVLGFYLSQHWPPKAHEEERAGPLFTWLGLLVAWPCALSLVPFQNIPVTLVGLRTAIFFLPFLLFGGRLRHSDLRVLTRGLAVLNLLALTFGILEYFIGVEKFFPKNDVTIIIYLSNDMAGSSLRIPSIFMSAHAYAGAMVMTIPAIFGGWLQPGQARTQRYLLLSGIVAALMGVVLAATRIHFAAAAALVVFAGCLSGVSITKRITWVTALIIVSVITLGSDDRMKRFTSLGDANVVNNRINLSVNQSVWDILSNYPFGNGLGGGGTSMPYFLANQVKDMIVEENEFAHILAEQGVIGLFIWLAFLAWLFVNKAPFKKCSWRAGRLLAWFASLFYFCTAFIGTGMLSAVPATVIMLLLMGWMSSASSEIEENCIEASASEPKRKRRKLAAVLQG